MTRSQFIKWLTEYPVEGDPIITAFDADSGKAEPITGLILQTQGEMPRYSIGPDTPPKDKSSTIELCTDDMS